MHGPERCSNSPTSSRGATAGPRAPATEPPRNQERRGCRRPIAAGLPSRMTVVVSCGERWRAGMREVDVAIVGAGPTGLFAAYYAGFRGLTVAVIDTLPEPGGQITAMYPEKDIFDVGGLPSIKGRDLVANLVAQAAPFAP